MNKSTDTLAAPETLKIYNYIISSNLRESCRDWTSSSIGPMMYIPYYCIPWHPLSIMSFISVISDDTVNPTPPLTPDVAAPARTAVSMEAVPEL